MASLLEAGMEVREKEEKALKSCNINKPKTSYMWIKKYADLINYIFWLFKFSCRMARLLEGRIVVSAEGAPVIKEH